MRGSSQPTGQPCAAAWALLGTRPCPQEGEFSTKVSFQGPAGRWEGSVLVEAALGHPNPPLDHRVLFYPVHQDGFSLLQDFSCSVMRTHPRWVQNGLWVTKHFWCRKKSSPGAQNIPGEDDAVAQQPLSPRPSQGIGRGALIPCVGMPLPKEG